MNSFNEPYFTNAMVTKKLLAFIDFLPFLYLFLDFIACNFEKNFCDWQRIPANNNGQKYAWTRNTSQSLADHGFEAPPEDIAGY